MKLIRIRNSRAIIRLLEILSDYIAGNNGLSYLIGLALAVGGVFIAFLLMGRVNQFNEDHAEESFSRAKVLKNIVWWLNASMCLWLFLCVYNFLYTVQFSGFKGMLAVAVIASAFYSWFILQKFEQANHSHNIDLAKANKGDPSIVMAENYGLSKTEKEAVSMIVGNAGHSSVLRKPMSDEQLYGPIDDPVFDLPGTPHKLCPSCGTVNKASYTVCSHCGTPLGEAMSDFQIKHTKSSMQKAEEIDDPVKRILMGAGVYPAEKDLEKKAAVAAVNDDKALSQATEKNMLEDLHTPRKICKSCGKVNSAEYTICSYCGTPLGEIATKEQMEEVNKILKADRREKDPVKRILKSAGVMKDDGTIISKNSSSSANSIAGVLPIGVDDKADENISVTELQGNYDAESGLAKPQNPQKGDSDIAITALEGNYNSSSDSSYSSANSSSLDEGGGFWSSGDYPDGIKQEKEIGDILDIADQSDKNKSLSSGDKIDRIRCPHCNRLNNKRNTICSYCGKDILQ